VSAEHTPGPWHASEEAAGNNPDIYIEAPGHGTVAEIGGGPLPVRRANARLIAAAPAMKEALEKIARYQGEHDGQDFDTAFQAVEKIARAALAKQDGRGGRRG
jgi:hypothetical protein